MIFDTHAHYDDDAFHEDRDSILSSLFENNIEAVVNVSSDLESIDKSLDLANRYDNVYCALGIHPTDTGELTDEALLEIKNKCSNKKVVAVGEIGLDYHWDTPDRAIQKKWFEKQLIMARELNLPIIIHSRDAAEDTINILNDLHAEETGGVIHCYSYTKEMAERFLKLGFYFGIGGVITYKNAKKIVEAVDYIPMEKIILETDCPYLSPDPNRGKRNSSLNLPYVIEKIAQIKGLSPEEVMNITSLNAKKMYRISN